MTPSTKRRGKLNEIVLCEDKETNLKFLTVDTDQPHTLIQNGKEITLDQSQIQQTGIYLGHSHFE